MRDRTIVQWDKDDLQRPRLDQDRFARPRHALAVARCVRAAHALLSRASARSRSNRFPPTTAPTYEMLQRADSIGVFQVESRAQQSMLPRMKPALLLRHRHAGRDHPPGPDSRRHDPSVLAPAQRPRTRDVSASETQTDSRTHARRAALSRARHAHGDGSRRLLGGRSRPAAPRDGAQALARTHGTRSIRGWSTAWWPTASIARPPTSSFTCSKASPTTAFPNRTRRVLRLLAYASAYVKCHEPAIFCAAILNVQPMGFYSTEVLVNDARRHGVVVKPVAVNESEWWSFVDTERRAAAGLPSRARHGRSAARELERALARRAARAMRRTIYRSARLRAAHAARARSDRKSRRRRRVRAVVSRRGAKRCGRCAARRTRSARRTRPRDGDRRRTGAALQAAQRRSKRRRSTSVADGRQPTCSRSRTSARSSTRRTCSRPNALGRDAEQSRLQGRRARHHAAASRHGERLRLPHARGRDGPR